MRSMTEGLLQSKGTTPQALTRQKAHQHKKGTNLRVRSLFIFHYFTRWRLIFIEVVFSNAVVRSSTFRTCL